MRFNTSKVLTALAVIVALAAATATTATASLPEFTGTFPNKFTAKTVTEPLFETSEGVGLEKCTSGEGLGEITGSKNLSVTSGKLLMGEPNGELGYISRPTVGLKITPKSGGKFPEMLCNSFLSVWVEAKGAFICKLSPVNVQTTKFIQRCNEAKGVMTPRAFEGMGINHFETEGFLEAKEHSRLWAWTESGITSETEITTAKITEIKA